MELYHKQQIAFVFFPHQPEAARLDTMPFATHILGWLAASGWHIDVFLWSKLDLPDDASPAPRNIHYKYVKLLSRRSKLNLLELTIWFARCIAYSCVFSVGQVGSYIGGIISTASRCPYVLLNEEFPSCWGPSIWNPLERWAARRADAIIVPSDDRQPTLREELRLDSAKPFITIRNAPELTLPLVHADWHKLMNIPYEKKIFLHAGSLADWAQVPEILVSVSYWPADAVLLLHSRSQNQSARYRKQLSHLYNPERVFWSPKPLCEDMLHSLISYCSGSFGLYRNCGPNVEHVGTSSGKIMRSIVCGTPVIASSFPSLDFVTREGLGLQVSHPSEIPIAVGNLMRNREIYRKRCLLFAISEKSLREEAWDKIVKYVRSGPKGVDLSAPTRRMRVGRYSATA